MKWVVRIAGVLALVLVISVAGLWIASNRRDAGRIRGSVDINRPTDEVFAWLNEPDKLTQWVGWLAEVQNDPTTPKAGIGHRETWVMDDPRLKQKMSVPGQITVWDPPQQMGVHVEMPQMYAGDVFYKLTDIGGGRTRFEEDARFHYMSRVASLLEPVTTPDAMRKMVEDMHRLKEKIEAQPDADTTSGAPDSTSAQ